MIDNNNGNVWKDRLYMVLPIFLVILVVLNVVSFFWNREKVSGVRDEYSKSYSSFTNELVNIRLSYLSTVSNYLNRSTSTQVMSNDRQSSDLASVVTNKVVEPKCHKTTMYRYLIYDGRRVIRYYGRYYEEGSPMSFGRIAKIFPDRVFFEDGSFIENTRNPDTVADRLPSIGDINND